MRRALKKEIVCPFSYITAGCIKVRVCVCMCAVVKTVKSMTPKD